MRENQNNREDKHDPTVAHLLSHLQQMRKAVPVNYQLKAELRKRLLEQMKNQEVSQASTGALTLPWKQRRMWIVFIMCASLLLTMGIWLSAEHTVSITKLQNLDIPNDINIQDIAISQDGEKVAYLDNSRQLHIYLVQEGREDRPVTLPRSAGTYHAISWTASSNRIIAVEEQQEESLIWLMELGKEGSTPSSRLLKEMPQTAISSIQWEQQSQQMMIDLITNRKQEIWRGNSVTGEISKMIEGTESALSKDGTKLAFSHQGKVWCVDIKTNEKWEIGQGSSPSWYQKDAFTFLSTEQVMYEATFDGNGFRTMQVPYQIDKSEQLVRANWSIDGRFMLVATQGSEGTNFSIMKRDW